MMKQKLHEGWTLEMPGGRPWARGQNITYARRFTPDEGMLDCGELILCLESTGGIAGITLNGTPLTDPNVPIPHELTVTCLVHKGINTLLISLQPGRIPEPRPDISLPVTLLGQEGARINDVSITQTHLDGSIQLRLGVSAVSSGNLELAASLTDPRGTVTPFPSLPMLLTIDDPLLWWPRGYGGQPLYTVRVEAKIEGRVVDSWERRIGLRTASVSIDKDEYGESFAHEINGVKIFAMGAVYAPEENILSRPTPQSTRRLLEDAALANFNCIRVRGSGCYPDDSFYDACDELGLMVWQDFIFSGSGYELTPGLAADVRREVRDNVTRLKHHPSIVLWCGNNQLELSAAAGGTTPRQRADYIRLFEYIIPTELRELDHDAFYWPSSPSSGGGFDEPNSLSSGDAHPKCSDRSGPGRYVSAFGTPSCPCLPTVESFTKPSERNLFSRAMEEHSESPGHTAHIMANIQRHYLCPTSFDTLIYASQLAQAEILRSAAQHYRQHRGRCMGALFRQLNDSRPEISCSSMDCFGRWKALHYFARRFFEPLLLSCEEPGMPAQSPDTGAGPSDTEKGVRLCVTNDTLSPRTVLIKWALRNSHSRVIREETISLTVPPLQSARLDRVPLPEADIFRDFVSYALYEKGVPVSFGTALFVPPKYYSFRDPQLQCRLEGGEIIVSSKSFARGVEIRNAAEDLILSDNYFDMLPGERRIKILRGSPQSLRLRSVYDIK
ncbi:beta-mannosidase [Acutalibacter sp. 1XD8-36]|uniref:beta-mannosidase n=1 Tax=Acutalibacter sp. 1XD8-36 TaxID=2320852 RepID=UPI00260276C5|nr:glycoside hydrolase family 2 protein [Acutalibacter sp. 1XD8-36]